MSSLLADARYLATRAIELEALLSRLADHGYDDTTADDEAVRRAAGLVQVLVCLLEYRRSLALTPTTPSPAEPSLLRVCKFSP